MPEAHKASGIVYALYLCLLNTAPNPVRAILAPDP
jgi:hypothetical protein